jgi:hypothetical protein
MSIFKVKKWIIDEFQNMENDDYDILDNIMSQVLLTMTDIVLT